MEKAVFLNHSPKNEWRKNSNRWQGYLLHRQSFVFYVVKKRTCYQQRSATSFFAWAYLFVGIVFYAIVSNGPSRTFMDQLDASNIPGVLRPFGWTGRQSSSANWPTHGIGPVTREKWEYQSDASAKNIILWYGVCTWYDVSDSEKKCQIWRHKRAKTTLILTPFMVLREI